MELPRCQRMRATDWPTVPKPMSATRAGLAFACVFTSHLFPFVLLDRRRARSAGSRRAPACAPGNRATPDCQNFRESAPRSHAVSVTVPRRSPRSSPSAAQDAVSLARPHRRCTRPDVQGRHSGVVRLVVMVFLRSSVHRVAARGHQSPEWVMAPVWSFPPVMVRYITRMTSRSAAAGCRWWGAG